MQRVLRRLVLLSIILVSWLIEPSTGYDMLIIEENIEIEWYRMTNRSYYSIKVKVPNHYYIAFSYGGTHVNSDMLVLKADGTQSSYYDMWSYGYQEPERDSSGHYSGNTSYSSTTDTVIFNLQRYLNTYDDKDFVVDLDQPIRIGYAIREYDNEKLPDQSDWVGNFGSH